jgi:hypothetical protein
MKRIDQLLGCTRANSTNYRADLVAIDVISQRSPRNVSGGQGAGGRGYVFALCSRSAKRYGDYRDCLSNCWKGIFIALAFNSSPKSSSRVCRFWEKNRRRAVYEANQSSEGKKHVQTIYCVWPDTNIVGPFQRNGVPASQHVDAISHWILNIPLGNRCSCRCQEPNQEKYHQSQGGMLQYVFGGKLA